MSGDFIIEVIDQINLIQIETSVLDTINNIEIERYQTFNVELSTNLAGSVFVSDIIGLDSYLDHYEFDCGTP